MPELVRGNHGSHSLPTLRRAARVFALMICGACAPAVAASGKCKLGQMAEFPVTMDRMSPEIVAKINGTDVKLIIDSGSFYSSLDAGSAAALGLHVYPAPVGFYGQAIGGKVTWSITKVSEFTLPRGTLHDLDFIVGGSHMGGRPSA